MMLVADSGSTKTLWACTATGQRMRTEGLNPLCTSEEQMGKTLTQVRDSFRFDARTDGVSFYGAGCGLATTAMQVQQLLRQVFGTEQVQVAGDMLGACRAVCGDNSGVVGIVGTGSNCCCYDGQQISFQPASTGWILGDHGSANQVGRRLVHDYLTERMPAPLRQLFAAAHPRSREQWMEAVYRRANANRLLASTAPFALEHSATEYCHAVLRQCMYEWYEQQVTPCLQHMPGAKVHIVGGFGAAIGKGWQQWTADTGVTVGCIVADPMDGLLHFHRSR